MDYYFYLLFYGELRGGIWMNVVWWMGLKWMDEYIDEWMNGWMNCVGRIRFCFLIVLWGLWYCFVVLIMIFGDIVFFLLCNWVGVCFYNDFCILFYFLWFMVFEYVLFLLSLSYVCVEVLLLCGFVM